MKPRHPNLKLPRRRGGTLCQLKPWLPALMLPAFGEHLKATQTEKHRTTDEEHRHYLLVVVEEEGRVARNCCNGGNSCQRGNTSTVQLFDFENSKVRVVEIEGNPWFVAADVAELLFGYTTGLTHVYSRLGTDEQRIVSRSDGIGFPLFGNSKTPKIRLISESGLYKLVMRSDKPEAKGFQNWLVEEVTYGKPDHQGIPRDAVRLP